MDRNYYINRINMLQDKLKDKRDENYDCYSISEYDSVYQDILDYQDNNFENFYLKDLIQFVEYLEKLVK